MNSLKRKLKKLLQLIGFFLINLGKPSSPFQKSSGDKEKFIKLASEASEEIYPEVDDFELQTGFRIEQEWIESLALHTQIVIKQSKLCYAPS